MQIVVLNVILHLTKEVMICFASDQETLISLQALTVGLYNVIGSRIG